MNDINILPVLKLVRIFLCPSKQYQNKNICLPLQWTYLISNLKSPLFIIRVVTVLTRLEILVNVMKILNAYTILLFTLQGTYISLRREAGVHD